jgi:hypothetical protein
MTRKDIFNSKVASGTEVPVPNDYRHRMFTGEAVFTPELVLDF